MMADPRANPRAALLAEAYRRGVMTPAQTTTYEEGVRRGIVEDPYAAARLRARSPTGVGLGALQTLERSLPGVSEAHAAVNAGVQTVGDLASGQNADFGKRFDENRTLQQAYVDELHTQHPTAANAASSVGTAGQIIAAIMTGGASEIPEAGAAANAARPGLAAAITAGAKKVAVGTAKNAVTGSTIAAVNAAAQPGTATQRVQAANNAIIPGAVVGAALPAGAAGAKLAGKGARVALNRLGAGASESADAVVRAVRGFTPADQTAPVLSPAAQANADQEALALLRRTGATPDGLRNAALDANGAPITTAEAAGPTAMSMASGFARRSGTTGQAAEAALTARRLDRNARILDTVHKATGVDPEAAQGSVEAVVKAGQSAADPRYTAIRAQEGPVWNADLARLAERPAIKKALGQAATNLRNQDINPAAHGLPVDEATGATLPPAIDAHGGLNPDAPASLSDYQLQPTARAWLEVKQALGQSVDRHPITGRVLPDTQSPGNAGINASVRDLTGALTDAIPGYRDALDVSGDYLSHQSAFDAAKGKLFSRQFTPKQFQEFVSGLKPADVSAVKASVANDIFNGMQSGTLQPGAFRPDAVRLKLGALFGPQTADSLGAHIQREADMAAFENRARPNTNSVTGNVLGAGADQEEQQRSLEAGLQAGGHAVRGNWLGAANALIKPALRGALNPAASQGTRNALGDIFFNKTPEEVATMLEQSPQAPPVAISRPTIPAITYNALTGIGRDQGAQNAR